MMVDERSRPTVEAEGARRATGASMVEVAGAEALGGRQETEVVQNAKRRRFTAEYKVNILRLADECREPGSLGALLRKEGLYSSTLTLWRKQREKGALTGLGGSKRGRKVLDRAVVENRKLAKENQHLRKRLERAELIIDVQKKVSQLIGIPLQKVEGEEDD
jgi:transposase